MLLWSLNEWRWFFPIEKYFNYPANLYLKSWHLMLWTRFNSICATKLWADIIHHLYQISYKVQSKIPLGTLPGVYFSFSQVINLDSSCSYSGRLWILHSPLFVLAINWSFQKFPLLHFRCIKKLQFFPSGCWFQLATSALVFNFAI